MHLARSGSKSNGRPAVRLRWRGRARTPAGGVGPSARVDDDDRAATFEPPSPRHRNEVELMYDLTAFGLRDMAACGSALRKCGSNARCMEEAAKEIVAYLYDNLGDATTGERSCVLVRFFKTHAYGDLAEDQRHSADALLGAQPRSPAMKCLTLVATAGSRAEWNDRRQSARHKAIPLPSATMVEQIPMISQLLNQLGLDVAAVVGSEGAPLMLDAEQRTYNVFHVPDALGSPYIPAQEDFVVPMSIRSVLGFGGILPLGDFFTVILFSRAEIPQATTALFKPLALCTKAAVLPFVDSTVFS